MANPNTFIASARALTDDGSTTGKQRDAALLFSAELNDDDLLFALEALLAAVAHIPVIAAFAGEGSVAAIRSAGKFLAVVEIAQEWVEEAHAKLELLAKET